MKDATMHTMFKVAASRPETLMDRVSRAAKEIVTDESQQRADKTARLRKARLEREAGTSAEPPSAAPARARTKPAKPA